MERKNISLSYGIRRSPSIGTEGELSECVNLIPKNGELVCILPPKETGITLNEGEVLLYVHRTTDYTNYIYLKDNILHAFKEINGSRTDLNFSHQMNYYNKVRTINSVGNTLVLLTDEGMMYILWKENDYVYLGDRVPDIGIQFGLIGRARLYSVSDDSKSTFKITFDGINEDSIEEEFSTDNQIKITEQVMGRVNKFVREQGVMKGRFCFPFFVRYALRLFDGSLVNHSAPILMNPSTKHSPIVLWKRIKGSKRYTEAEMDIMLVSAGLTYRFVSGGAGLMDRWKDIVKSVDVYISTPIYTYDQNGICKSFYDTDNFDTSFIGKLYSEDYSRSQPFSPNGKIQEDVMMGPFASQGGEYPFRNYFSEWKYKNIYAMYFSADRTYPGTTLNLPERDEETMRDELTSTSLFYFLESIKTENIKYYAWNEIEIADTYLENITLKERMTDDYQTHDRLMPSYLYSYNQRLNAANIRRELFDGFDPLVMFSCKAYNVAVNVSNNSTHELSITTGFPSDITIYTYINEEGREIVVESPANSYLSPAPFLSEGDTHRRSWPSYLFYPNPNAYKMVVKDYMGSYEIPLREHKGLNAAYALLDYDIILSDMKAGTRMVSQNKVVHSPNKIYTSEVGNPFYFPLGGINTVGTGEIIGISSATKALSQGQFGEFPLYVFSSDGIWAMQVNPETGLYSSTHPVSRDVCNNPKSITQTDSAIVFTTDEGLKILQGAEIALLSAHMQGHNTDEEAFNISPDFKDLFVKDTQQFVDMLKDCMIAYDYPHSTLHIFKADGTTKHYIYSIDSGEFTCYVGYSVQAIVNNYPQTIVQIDNRLCSYDNYTSSELHKGIAVTRTMAFDDPFAMKIIHDLRVMGYNVSKGSGTKVAIFISNDQRQWGWLPSLKMRSFKFYRFVLYTEMADTDTISGLSVLFDYRRTNKLR